MFPDASGGYRSVEIGGGPIEIGLALGRLHADAVRQRVVGSDAWREVVQRGRTDTRMPAMLALVRERFPDILRELEGLAEGLDQPFEDVFAWNCRGDLWAMAPDGCTTVRFPAGSGHVIGHNEDGMPALAGHCSLVRVNAGSGRGYTAFVYPGSLPGHTFAVTSAGIVQTVNNIRSLQAEAGVPRMVMTRAILDAPDLDAAVTLLRGAPRAGAFHLTLAQRGDPRLLAVEFTGSRVSIEELSRPSVHANHLVHDDMRGLKQIVTDSSRQRQLRGDALVGGIGEAPGEHDALRILLDREGGDLPIHRGDLADPDHENTLATALFRVEADRIAWAVYDGNAAAARAAAA